MIPSIESLRRASEIIQQIEALQSELAGLFGSGAVSAPVAGKRRGRPPGGGKKRRNMSTEGRERIAAAARARWARFHAAKKKAAKD
jgi:hypothetical protein